VHKTQGLTLPEISVSLDQRIFSVSHCSNWSNVHIATFHPSAFITDKSMIKEYERLEQKASTPLPL
jgi:hypothetical protein